MMLGPILSRYYNVYIMCLVFTFYCIAGIFHRRNISTNASYLCIALIFRQINFRQDVKGRRILNVIINMRKRFAD